MPASTNDGPLSTREVACGLRDLAAAIERGEIGEVMLEWVTQTARFLPREGAPNWFTMRPTGAIECRITGIRWADVDGFNRFVAQRGGD